MTDFRRPDLDLWDEEDDGEDQRPTIVSERPPAPAGLPPLARMSLVQRLIAKGELEDSDELRAAFAAQRGNITRPPAARGARSPSMPSPIETAAREAADARDSTEILDERELDLLRLSEALLAPADRAAAALDDATPLSAPLPQVARPAPSSAGSRAPAEPQPARPAAAQPHEALLVRPKTQPGVPRPQALDARASAGDAEDDLLPSERTEVRPPAALSDSGPLRREHSALHRMDEIGQDAQLERHPQMSDEDFVPTRLARRPRTSALPTQRVPPDIIETPVFRDREITERVSIPPLASSIAPAARTVRPHLRPQTGMGGWQLALVAMLLVGAGLGVARLRRESAAANLTARVRSAVSAALEPSAAEVIAQPDPVAAQPAPAEPAPAQPSVATAEAPADPAPELAEALVAAEREQREQRKAARAAQEAARRAAASGSRAAPAVEAPAAPAEPAAAAAREPVAEARAPAESAPRTAKPEAPGASNLPAQPSRDEVRAALNAVVPELQKCAGSLHGTADVTMTVRSAGVVSYAVVAGTFAGTPEGSCIARTVKLAKFPAFSEPSVRVSYPFEL